MKAPTLLAATLAASLAATTASAEPAGELQGSARAIRAHMTFLSSDLLEGREAGTRGYDLAAEYAAAQFALLGLRPAGDGGSWFQRVPLVTYRLTERGRLTLQGPARRVELVPGEDFIGGRNPRPQLSLRAPLVFVGYGVVDPGRGRDDYADLDVRGKIVVALEGAPAAWQTEERAYHRSGATKRLLAEARGAVGFLTVNTPVTERLRPFEAAARTWRAEGVTWRTPDGRAFVAAPGTPSLGAISVKGAAKLFAGAPAPLDHIYAAAASEAADPPRFDLPQRLEVALTAEVRESESRNVAALVPGKDPSLAHETVILSAHLDHVGLSDEGADRIPNGALDNAAGVATAFEMARLMMQPGARPRRSVLVLLVTAEEKGLIGSEYFARNPTRPLAGLVANVNLDMPILTYPFTDVVAFGAERSDIGTIARGAALRMGVALSPDPLPEEGLFTRSDHYSFVEVGVPSIFLMTGFANGGETRFREFLRTCYHKACDDLSQPIDYQAAARFARLNYEIARDLANAPRRPAWKPGDFFGERFGPQRQP